MGIYGLYLPAKPVLSRQLELQSRGEGPGFGGGHCQTTPGTSTSGWGGGNLGKFLQLVEMIQRIFFGFFRFQRKRW